MSAVTDVLTPPAPIRVSPADEAIVRRLVDGSGVSEVFARVLAARGLESPADVARFLTPTLERDWRDPEGLPGMAECAAAVAAAVRGGRRIVVFGDFDVDGLTAAAVAARGLALLGANVVPIVPHRFLEGYGLSPAAVIRVLAQSPGMVVTVDCGISSADEVALLRAAGVEVVVTDHHEPAGGVPQDVALCDPKLGGAEFDGLAGAGVALKLVAAVGRRLGSPEVWRELTGLAALGTIGDVVPLVDENRAIVADGVARLRVHPPAGLAALCESAGTEAGDITAERVAFVVGPRLNAAGRMSDPAEALELLMTDDPSRATELARGLEEHNRSRQLVEGELLEAACVQAASKWRDGLRVLVLAGEGWHEGVKGIVATRIAARYGVPALLFCIEGDEARGSGRSVGGIDLHAAIVSLADMLTRFGGHAAAVGVTLPSTGIDEFARRLDAELAKVPADASLPHTIADAELRLADATEHLALEFAALEPFGEGNPKPVIASRGIHMSDGKRVGPHGVHLKFDAVDGLAMLPAIAFRCERIDTFAGCSGAVDIAYHLDVDSWQGRRRVQLLVQRIAPHPETVSGAAADLVEGLFADAARILARADYDGIAEAESFHTKLAGVTFEGRQEAVARLAPGARLTVSRQPDNAFDPCAIALLDGEGVHVGFFNRRLAAVLAPAMDGGAAWDVTVSEVTGGADGRSLGVNVLVARADAGPEADAEQHARDARRAGLTALAAPALEAALVRGLAGDCDLYPAQTASLEHLAAGRSCLTVMATGRGKSLIFQLHAARQALQGGRASVFVYPLRALVADQAVHLADAFASFGLSVALLTGDTAPGAREQVLADVGAGRIDAVLTTPESFERHAHRLAQSGRIGFVVVDEAHHVALSGSGHRPAYTRLGETLRVVGDLTVCAVTATASDDVAAAIRETLGIEMVVVDPTRRENLRVVDRRGRADKVAHIAKVAAGGEKVIVYVNSREQSVSIAGMLRGVSPLLSSRVAFYNGGVPRGLRHAIEAAFRTGDITAIVATSAFGEGVNIPDVRHVALLHLPFNRVEFNQMCGRAGRDGQPADVHVLFGERDAKLNELILESSAPDLDELRTLYATLRDRATASPDGWVEATNEELSQDVRKRRKGARLSDRGASSGIGVFRDLGLVAAEGIGQYRRLRVVPVEGKVDMASSLRYAEGLEEVEGFAEFRKWVLESEPDDLRRAFDRPIVPLSVRDAQAVG